MTAHNPVLKTVGTVKGMGIDTSHFRKNRAYSDNG